ncbi:MAG: hypothetical protein UT32_C0002G0036 [Parcubacteria group bacterium GW2011_GWC2_39_14]|nr:MAG: hypothetical protein UT32_C0002G0036 [Parcubacteria group bacterium GW2011_GWC2_39_14]KKR55261.1 MAG: hypothetical protein UT91_C0003G0036 [Parcubacteria group bacterium GW2011_GWA2_40_23]
MNILLLIIFIFAITFAYAGIRGAPWAPTKKNDVPRFLELADIKGGEKVYDLGCGDGRLLFAAAEKGAEVIGYEISLLPYLIAKIKQFSFVKKEHTRIFFKDFWHVNLAEADLVYFFLMPKIYDKLKAKFEKELKPGSRVIAYVWPIEGWTPIKVSTLENAQKIYLYKIK